MPYQNFSLTLMLTHACNMRCTYCYTGEKAARRMPPQIAHTAIRRAIASTSPGGHLDLGFFGGEPLLEAPSILRYIDRARTESCHAGIDVSFHLTTNATITTPAAWNVLTQSDVRVAVSCDGLPAAHDRFRIFADQSPTSTTVYQTIDRLVRLHKPFSVIIVVRPETAAQLPANIRFLRSLGVNSIEPSLDLWTHWTRADAAILRRAIAAAAELWQEGLPHHALNWFDEKAAQLSNIPISSPRCSFGNGELAIAPSGNLYPCERLINEDLPTNPMRLPGHILESTPTLAPELAPGLTAHLPTAPHAPANPFPPFLTPPGQQADACHTCSMKSLCNATCRCSNFIRTHNPTTPDGLLCLLNQACLEEVIARLQPPIPKPRLKELHICPN